jgi:hypothetical protein
VIGHGKENWWNKVYSFAFESLLGVGGFDELETRSTSWNKVYSFDLALWFRMRRLDEVEKDGTKEETTVERWLAMGERWF